MLEVDLVRVRVRVRVRARARARARVRVRVRVRSSKLTAALPFSVTMSWKLLSSLARVRARVRG